MTLAYATTRNTKGKATLVANYIVATSNDGTTNANGPAIDNSDGSIVAIAAEFNATAAGGTSPTANIKIQGTIDGTNWVTVPTSSGFVHSGATSISAGTTLLADSDAGGRRSLPYKQLRGSVALAGTSPTWEGTVNLMYVQR